MHELSTRRDLLRRAALASAALSGRAAAAVEGNQDWRYYGGDQQARRYSALDQIRRSNVGGLRVAWTHATGDAMRRPATTIECTPLVVDGRMYITTARLKVQALDAASGKLLWSFDPFANVTSRRARGVNRGVTFCQVGGRGRLFVAAGSDMYCLDAATGKPAAGFAADGVLDMTQGLDRDITGVGYNHNSPPVVFEDLLVLGGGAGEGPRPASPGHIRAYDVRTGKRRWIFHTIPHPGELGYETWGEDNWKTTGGCNNWAGMSLDAERGLVFASLGSPAFDFYGGDRPGANLFGNSVVALDVRSGERKWHFQAVHHDLWDYDLGAQPALVRAKAGGRWRDAVAQVTKMGFLFLLDRETGEPLYEVEERAVPASDVPGEQAWPTQPFPSAPEPYARQGLEEADVTDLSEESRDFVLRRLKDLRNEGLYTPPSKRGSVYNPGTMGGTTWGGCSCDPEAALLFVNTNNTPKFFTLVDAPEDAGYPYRVNGYPFLNDQDGYPASKPPWGELLCLDLATMEYRWHKPLGEHEELTARGVPQTGTFNIGGSIATKGGLVFIGGTQDEKFRAFDSETGERLWQHRLPAGGYATPCTYSVDGKQYVAIAAGGGGKPRTESGDQFVAFALE